MATGCNVVAARERAVASGEWLKEEYWKSLCPECTVSNVSQPGKSWPALQMGRCELQEFSARLDTDGYFSIGAVDLPESNRPQYYDTVRKLAVAVAALVKHDWPASFVSIFDEAWLLAHLLSALVRESTGGNELMMDLVAWHIDPTKGQTGFTPHRDRHFGLDEQGAHVDASSWALTYGRGLNTASVRTDLESYWSRRAVAIPAHQHHARVHTHTHAHTHKYTRNYHRRCVVFTCASLAHRLSPPPLPRRPVPRINFPTPQRMRAQVLDVLDLFGRVLPRQWLSLRDSPLR